MSKKVSKNVKSVSSKQALAIPYLARGESNTTVARRVGVSRQTIGNWFNKPEFIATFEKYQKDYIEKIYTRSIADLQLCYETLRQILSDPDSSNGEKIRAATNLAKFGNSALTAYHFDKRLTALEEASELLDGS